MPLDTSAASLPFARLRVGTLEGWFLLDTATTFSEIDAVRAGVAHGTLLRIETSSLPAFDTTTFQALDTGGRPAPPGGAAGSIGTDVFRSRTVLFDYEAAEPYALVSQIPCPPAKLLQNGFARIDQSGYYGMNWDAAPRLRDGSGAGLAIPVVFLRIGTVTAPGWIDSGFSETGKYPPPGTIRINPPLFDAVRASGMTLTPAGHVSNTNCDNQRASESLWRMTDARLQFTDASGQLIRDEPMPLLQVAQPHSCGGPAAIGSPLALLGAAYLHRWGTTVFDGLNQAVWIRRQPLAPISSR